MDSLRGILAVATLLLAPFPGLGAGATAEAPAAERVVIVNGRQKILEIPFAIGSGANSNPSVVQAVPRVKDRQVILFGKSVGGATYTVFDGSKKRRLEFDIQVVDLDLAKLAGDVKDLVGDLEGVTVKIVGDLVLIEGEVATADELNRIDRLMAGRDFVQNLVRLSPIAMRALAKTIEQNIDRDGVTASAGGVTDGPSIDDERERAAEALESLRRGRLHTALGLSEAAAKTLAPVLDPFSERRRAAIRGLLESPTAAGEKAYRDIATDEWAAIKKKLPAADAKGYRAFQEKFDSSVLNALRGE